MVTSLLALLEAGTFDPMLVGQAVEGIELTMA